MTSELAITLKRLTVEAFAICRNNSEESTEDIRALFNKPHYPMELIDRLDLEICRFYFHRQARIHNN